MAMLNNQRVMKKISSVSNLHQTLGSRKPHRVIMFCGSQESSGFCPTLPQMCETRYKQMWVPDGLSFFGKQFVKRQALDDQLLSAAWSTGLGMCVDSGAISFCPYERTPLDLQKWLLKLLNVNFSCFLSWDSWTKSGWWFGTWLSDDFPIILGMSSSQLTIRHIFQRGRSTTNQIIINHH